MKEKKGKKKYPRIRPSQVPTLSVGPKTRISHEQRIRAKHDPELEHFDQELAQKEQVHLVLEGQDPVAQVVSGQLGLGRGLWYNLW